MASVAVFSLESGMDVEKSGLKLGHRQVGVRGSMVSRLKGGVWKRLCRGE